MACLSGGVGAGAAPVAAAAGRAGPPAHRGPASRGARPAGRGKTKSDAEAGTTDTAPLHVSGRRAKLASGRNVLWSGARQRSKPGWLPDGTAWEPFLPEGRARGGSTPPAREGRALASAQGQPLPHLTQTPLLSLPVLLARKGTGPRLQNGGATRSGAPIGPSHPSPQAEQGSKVSTITLCV